jgi:hypothetical protein
VYTLVRRYIRTGIAFLFVGLSIGLIMMVRRELLGIAAHPRWVAAHTHAVGAGFVLFMIMGVALWLFPRPRPEDRRYTPERVETAYWILTVSTAGRVLLEMVGATVHAPALRLALAAGAAGQVAGTGLYFWTMWGRIRAVGSHLREARGEKF